MSYGPDSQVVVSLFLLTWYSVNRIVWKIWENITNELWNQTPEWLFLYFCSYDIQSTGYCEKIWEKNNQHHCHHHSHNLVNSHNTLIDSTHGAGFFKQYHGIGMGSKIINCVLSAQIKLENRSSTLQILIKTWRCTCAIFKNGWEIVRQSMFDTQSYIYVEWTWRECTGPCVVYKNQTTKP
jgi:hypothetical protein